MGTTISRYLVDDHRYCDRLLAACEAAIAAGDAGAAATAALTEAIERHLRREEEVLFPELETSNPGASGPTGVMRMEHRQMRRLLADLAEAVDARDPESALGTLETLHLIVQQHNAKEEAILYPMADLALPGDRLTDRMQTV